MRSSARLGLIIAQALISGAAHASKYNISAPEGFSSQDIGYAIKHSLQNHYRTTGAGKPSRAAHYKRLAKKRRNIRARAKK